MSKKIKILVPAYYKQFQCIGGDCPDTCCKNWNIHIDKASYKRFKEDKHLALNPVRDRHIVINKERTNSTNYGIFKLEENNRLASLELDEYDHKYCPYLSEEKLCKIYLELGEAHMPDICRLYPRIPNRIDGEYECSLTLSCPVAARLALETPELMEFEYLEVDYDPIYDRMAASIATKQNYILRELWDIRVASIRILQNRKFDIPSRITLLGMLYQKIQKAIDEEKYQEIIKIVVDFLDRLEQTGEDVFSSLPKDRASQLLSLKFIFYSQMKSNKYSDRWSRMIEDVEILLPDAEEGGDVTISSDTVERFEGFNQEKMLPFIRSEEIMAVFEHYLVNMCFQKRMPFGFGKNIGKGVRYLASNYFIVKLLMAGRIFAGGEAAKEELIEIIYLYTKTMIQNDKYRKIIEEQLKFIDFDSLGGLYTLLFD